MQQIFFLQFFYVLQINTNIAVVRNVEYRNGIKFIYSSLEYTYICSISQFQICHHMPIERMRELNSLNLRNWKNVQANIITCCNRKNSILSKLNFF